MFKSPTGIPSDMVKERILINNEQYYEHRGTLTDIIQFTTNGSGAYLVVLDNRSRWYRCLDLDTDRGIQYLNELADLRTAQQRGEEVTFKAHEKMNNTHLIKTYEVHYVPRATVSES